MAAEKGVAKPVVAARMAVAKGRAEGAATMVVAARAVVVVVAKAARAAVRVEAVSGLVKMAVVSVEAKKATAGGVTTKSLGRLRQWD